MTSGAGRGLSDLLEAVRGLREQQRYGEADALLSDGVAKFPADPALAFFHAQTRFELGRPAAALFERALMLDPGSLQTKRNLALAQLAEGHRDAARGLLEAGLTERPDWLDGHKALATLNWTSGAQASFTDHLGRACRAQPDNPALWLAWFGNLAQARLWPEALATLDEAERHLGNVPAIQVSRLFVAVETGAPEAADLIAATTGIRGDVTSLCRIRHALRQGDPGLAAAEALPLTAGPSAALYWPYLSLAWRLLGDAQAQWLDQPERLIQSFESGCSAAELAKLADLLRTLHTSAQPYIEQSVRGGTQTDRSLLLRHEAPLQAIKARLVELIRDYIAALPPHDPQHPLLSAPRGGDLLIEGSWSVRLAQQGYNVPHTHARGWLSTAFYVALPDQMGVSPAGHIAFGQAPIELGLDLPAYRTIAPVGGRLAVFPSTMWHNTVPFDSGERLVIAFDVRRPAC